MASTKTIKTIAITLATAVTLSATAPMAVANAGHNKHKGELIAAGVIGLALGAIVADSSHRRRQRADVTYYNYPNYAPPQPVTAYPQPYYGKVPRGSYDNHRYERPRYQPPQPPRHYNKRKHRRNPVELQSSPRVITYDQAMRKSNAAEPWTPAWYSYCSGKFRSFNAKSGTYLGYDGQRHFCVAK